MRRIANTSSRVGGRIARSGTPRDGGWARYSSTSGGLRSAAVRSLEPKPVAASSTVLTRLFSPRESNASGNVHGGEIMRLIDECAGVSAMRHARARTVTARIDELSFLAPVYVGDVVVCLGSVNDVGETSMEVGVRVDAENPITGEKRHVASAYLVFVALDETGKPTRVPPIQAETPVEHRRQAKAKLRRAHRLARTAGATSG